MFLKCQPNVTPEPPVPVLPVDVRLAQAPDALRAVANQVAARLEQNENRALVEAVERVGQIPRDIDKQLLGGARAAIDRDLNSAEKKDVRKYFMEACRNRLRPEPHQD